MFAKSTEWGVFPQSETLAWNGESEVRLLSLNSVRSCTLAIFVYLESEVNIVSGKGSCNIFFSANEEMFKLVVDIGYKRYKKFTGMNLLCVTGLVNLY